MSSRITIKLKDGTTREFVERGRAGGSWTIRVTFEGAFVIVTDEWDTRTVFPAADVAEVVDHPARGGW